MRHVETEKSISKDNNKKKHKKFALMNFFDAFSASGPFKRLSVCEDTMIEDALLKRLTIKNVFTKTSYHWKSCLKKKSEKDSVASSICTIKLFTSLYSGTSLASGRN